MIGDSSLFKKIESNKELKTSLGKEKQIDFKACITADIKNHKFRKICLQKLINEI